MARPSAEGLQSAYLIIAQIGTGEKRITACKINKNQEAVSVKSRIYKNSEEITVCPLAIPRNLFYT